MEILPSRDWKNKWNDIDTRQFNFVCQIIPCNCKNEYSDWNNWSSCKGADNCAEKGIRFKLRSIDTRCMKECNELSMDEPCQIKFGEWSSWSQCNSTCGEKSFIKRSRLNLEKNKLCEEDEECSGQCSINLGLVGGLTALGTVTLAALALVLFLYKKELCCFKKVQNQDIEVKAKSDEGSNKNTVKKEDYDYDYDYEYEGDNYYRDKYQDYDYEEAYYSEDML